MAVRPRTPNAGGGPGGSRYGHPDGATRQRGVARTGGTAGRVRRAGGLCRALPTRRVAVPRPPRRARRGVVARPGQAAWPGGHRRPVPAPHPDLPDGWTELERFDGVQLVATDPTAVQAHAPRTSGGVDIVVLGPDDVGDMLDLVARTAPGPFEAAHPRAGPLRRHPPRRPPGGHGRRAHAPGRRHRGERGVHRRGHRGRGFAARLVAEVAHTASSPTARRRSCTSSPTTTAVPRLRVAAVRAARGHRRRRGAGTARGAQAGQAAP